MIPNHRRNSYFVFTVSLMMSVLLWADTSIAASGHEKGRYLTAAAASAKKNVYRGRDPYRNFPKSHNFPVSRDLRTRVEFWKKIYTKYTTRQVVIHDRDHLDVIYDVVNLNKKFRGKKVSSRTERKYKKKRKRRIVAILKKLYRNKGKAVTAQEKAIASKFAHVPGYRKFKNAARRVRGQLGQANRFRAGLKRSGRYIKTMRRIFRSHGLPEELTVLPNVESSFNYKAYSSAGAAGIWQFTRSTGRLFMKVNYTVDERRDPIVATDAAARLLKSNYKQLRSWPLAITAYNHGPNGMKRAKRRHGSNMGKIIKRYRSRSFGFASKNFYTEFLAALEVVHNYKRYFGKINFDPEFRYDQQVVNNFIPARTLAKKMGIPTKTLARYNPALRRSVWKGQRHIPRGYKLRVPKGLGNSARAAIASVSKSSRYAKQKRSGWHIVRRGDALSIIGRRYRVSVAALKIANGLHSNIIHVGQKLMIPGRAEARTRKKKVKTARVRQIPGSGKHYVQRGDSLYSIATGYGMNMKKLADINGMSLNDTIHPGQTISLVKTVNYAKVVSIAPVKTPKEIIAPATGSAKTEPASIQPESAEAARETAPVEVNGLSTIINGRMIQINASEYGVRVISNNTGTIRIKPEETIGHYAEWARVSIKRVKRLNGKRRMRSIRSGASIKIPLTRVSAERFEQKRLEYHMSLLEDFFDAYRVDGEKEVFIKRGQSLWDLCVKEHEAPVWLVRLYNPNMKLDYLMAGDSIIIPVVAKKQTTP